MKMDKISKKIKQNINPIEKNDLSHEKIITHSISFLSE